MTKFYSKTKHLAFAIAGMFSLILTVGANAQTCNSQFTSTLNNYDAMFMADSVINGAIMVWDYGDGSVVDSTTMGNHQYAVADTFVVCLTVNDTANACTSSYCDSVIVLAPACDATFSFAGGIFSAQSASGNNNLNFIWDFGDSTSDVGPTPAHTYANPGTYNVCLTSVDSSTGCSSVICDSVVINPACDATITYNSGFFAAQSASGNNNLNFIWNFGDATPNDSSQFVQHNYAAAGTYYVCLTSIDSSTNCTSTVCEYITIAPFCTSDFTYSNGLFVAQNTGGSANALVYVWDFNNDGLVDDTGQFVQYNYTTPGTYYACLTATDTLTNCVSAFCDSVIILPFCTSEFTYNNGNFSAQNIGGSANTLLYTWDFGDSSAADTGQFVQHNYPQAGTYYTCLTAVDTLTNCTSVFCDSVVIDPTCTSTFTYNNGFFIAQNSGGGFGLDYIWDFGDSTSGTGQFVQHSYTAAGTYYACLTAIDSSTNCFSTFCDSVVITVVGCDAAYTYADSSGTVHFEGSTTATGFIITYNWDFGDGQTGNGQNPSHPYTAAGTYNVCMIANDVLANCSDTVCQSITITTPVVVTCNSTINVINNANGAVSVSAQPFSLTLQFEWDFGDGTVGAGVFAQHTYAASGTYNVCLTTIDAGNNCTSQTCTTLVVTVSTTSLCEAAFTYSDDGLGNFDFQGTTAATGFLITYAWDFGDAGTATAQNSTHTYTVAGPYVVCFTVNDVLGGCTDSVCQTVDVSFTGIHSLAIDNSSIVIAPNPVKDNLLLSYTLNSNAKVSIEIYDILGKGIISVKEANQAFGQHNNTIDLSGIAAGSYILKLNVDGNIINKKLIKE